MVEAGTFKTYRWSIFNSDHSTARTAGDTFPTDLYCPVADKDRWIGDNSRGLSSLEPISTGRIVDWQQEHPTTEELDEKFNILKAEPDDQKVVVIFYFSGHGIMDKAEDGSTCGAVAHLKDGKV